MIRSNGTHRANDPFWLGQHLVDSQAITIEQYSSAKKRWVAQGGGTSFTTVLETLDLASPAHLAALIGEHFNLPTIQLGGVPFERETARLMGADSARRKCVLPFRRRPEKILDVAVADPGAYPSSEARRDFPDHEVRLHVAARSDILGAIEEAWRPPVLPATATEHFEKLLREAVAGGATDIHLEPRDRAIEVRLRIDGRLIHKGFIEGDARHSIIRAAKIAGRMDISETRFPQDGDGTIVVGSRQFHLRFSCLPAVNGEGVVVRIHNEFAGLMTFEQIGLTERNISHVRALLESPDGLIYVTGPTGAGKTTLCHSMLNRFPPDQLNELKIITLEEPVEIRNPKVFLQINVHERVGATFADILKYVLRHDPDVLLVGETRDPVTADVTLRAALTGHLCFSTLHTTDALGAIPRLVDMGIDPYMLSRALRGVIAQRLVRRPCNRCKVLHPDNALLLDRHRSLLEEEGIARPAFYSAGFHPDCPDCHGRGHKGRIAIVEIVPTRGAEHLVSRNAPPVDFAEHLGNVGSRSISCDGILKAAAGLTTIEEVLAATGTGNRSNEAPAGKRAIFSGNHPTKS